MLEINKAEIKDLVNYLKSLLFNGKSFETLSDFTPPNNAHACNSIILRIGNTSTLIKFMSKRRALAENIYLEDNMKLAIKHNDIILPP